MTEPDKNVRGIGPKERRYLSRHFDDYRVVVREVEPDAIYVIGQPNIMYSLWT